MFKTYFLGLLAIIVLTITGSSFSASQTKTTTLDNLQTAYNGETNANVKYLLYAKKADEEGYRQVALLFRAAAKAEEVHKNHLAMVIKKMGAAPKVEIKAPALKSTKENLEDALKGETYEKDFMYPEFIKQAKAEKNKDALRVFNGAKSAEQEHAKFYAIALKNLNQWKIISMEFFVCPNCGYTVDKLSFDKCPICYTEKGKFFKID